MTKRRLKKKYRIFLTSIFALICLICLIYSIINIINWKLDVDRNKSIQENISENIEVIQYNGEDNKVNKYNVDFKSLKEQNPDVVSYLKVNNTNIDYIVVRGKDNKYYLSHNFNKEYNVAGWIFSDYHNKFDDTDKNIIIFGHNTRDGSMFGTLKNVLNKEWYENKENHEVILVTEKDTYYYQVFSTYSVPVEDYYINTEFKDDNEFVEFIKTIKSRSIYDYGVDVSSKDRILTLSTCTPGATGRVVLHAKLMDN